MRRYACALRGEQQPQRARSSPHPRANRIAAPSCQPARPDQSNSTCRAGTVERSERPSAGAGPSLDGYTHRACGRWCAVPWSVLLVVSFPWFPPPRVTCVSVLQGYSSWTGSGTRQELPGTASLVWRNFRKCGRASTWDSSLRRILRADWFPGLCGRCRQVSRGEAAVCCASSLQAACGADVTLDFSMSEHVAWL